MVPGAQTIHIPAGVGLDESRREELINPGEANLEQTNVRLSELGALSHRLGHTSLALTRSTGGGVSYPRKIIAHGQGIVRAGHDASDARATDGTWFDIGSVPEVRCKRTSIASAKALTGTSQALATAYVNGYHVTASITGTAGSTAALVVHFTSRETGQTVYHYSLSAITNPLTVKLAVSGNYVWIIYTASASANIVAARIDASSVSSMIAAPSSTTLATDYLAGSYWDCAASATRVYIAYANTIGGTTRYSLRSFTASSGASVANTTITTANNTPCGVSIDVNDSDFLWVAHTTASSFDVFVEGRNPATLAQTSSQVPVFVLAAPAFYVNVSRATSTTCCVAASAGPATVGGGDWQITYCAQIQSAAAVTSVVGLPTRLPGWASYTKPICVSGRLYMVGQFATNDSRYELAVFDVTNGGSARFARPVANPVRNLAYYNTGLMAGPAPGQVDSTTFTIATYVRRNNAGTSVDIIELDFDSDLSFQTASHNGVTYMSAGCVYGYDGFQTFEANFIAPPTIRATASAGGALAAGVYVFFAIYEWVDNLGNVHWSEPSAVRSVTAALNNKIDYEVLFTTTTAKEPYSTTTKYRPVSIKVFRTLMGGGEYYLVAEHINNLTNVYGGTFNTTGTVTTDTGLTSAAKAYRHPGLRGTAQARMAPPAALDICEYSNGLATIAEDARTVWLTAQNIPGEGAWWNPVFQYDVAPNLVALREMDGQLFVWSRTGIYVTSGNLPVDNGRDGGLAQFRRLSANVGCIDPRSIVRTSLGIFFQSSRGIELLARSGEVIWIGQQVQDQLTVYPTITSAVHDTYDDCVIFTCTSDGATGVSLVYDLSAQLWVSVDQITSPSGTTGVAIRSATMAWLPSVARDVYVMLDVEGYILARDGTLADGTSDVASTWTTPWIKLGLQNEHQFWSSMLLFQRDGAASLAALVTYDWEASNETKSWTETEIGTYYRQVELRIKTNIQAFKVRFTATPTGGSAGLSFIGLSTDLAVEARDDGGLPHIAAEARK